MVDDEPDIRFFLRLNLELSGHEVDEAGDGDAAIAAITAEPPDAVVLDVMMPGPDGYEVLAELKASPDDRVASVPVVLLTALGDDIDIARGGIEGALVHLVKPITPEALLGAIDSVLAADEPDLRRRARKSGLSRLARIESGRDPAPGPRLGRLEHSRRGSPASPPEPAPAPVVAITSESLADLTPRQRDLVDTLMATSSVAAAAAELGVSRSNVYASLRRIARRLGVGEVPDLLQGLRSGELGSSPR